MPDRADLPPIDLSKTGTGPAARVPDEPTPLLPGPPPSQWSTPTHQQPYSPPGDAPRTGPPSVIDQWWPNQQTDTIPRRRSVPITPVLICVLALLIAGTAVIAFGFRSGHRAAADGPGSTSRLGPSSVGSSSTSAPPSATSTSSRQSETESTSASEPPTSTSATARGATQAYAGPGGLGVKGPRNWHRDYSAAISHVADYASPGTTTPLAGDYFRIGIGNTTPTGSFTDEANQAAKFLRHTYHADIISGPFYQRYLGTTAAQIEFQYVSSHYGVPRHGVERLWRRGDRTMIIESSGLSRDWQQTLTVFTELLSSAREQ